MTAREVVLIELRSRRRSMLAATVRIVEKRHYAAGKTNYGKGGETDMTYIAPNLTLIGETSGVVLGVIANPKFDHVNLDPDQSTPESETEW